MTFNEFIKEYSSEHGRGWKKKLADKMGMKPSNFSRMLKRDRMIGLYVLNRLLWACEGMVSMEELMKEFRPDIYKEVMKHGRKK